MLWLTIATQNVKSAPNSILNLATVVKNQKIQKSTDLSCAKKTKSGLDENIFFFFFSFTIYMYLCIYPTAFSLLS